MARLPIIYQHLGKNGRLGNQLWQIASTLGIAHYVGREASFSNWSYQSDFSVPKHLFSNQPGIPASYLATEIAKRHRIYLQDFHLFSEIVDLIRAYFRPSPTMSDRLRQKYPEVLDCEDKTAIHIRRFDFLKYPLTYPPLSVSYYQTAMSEVLKKFPKTKFFIFSDEIDWCKKNLRGDLHFVSESISYGEDSHLNPEGNATDAEDLFLMSLCDHHICSNSTYAWWAAFLSNNREPIVPTPWFGPEAADMNMSHYMLPEWKKLPNV